VLTDARAAAACPIHTRPSRVHRAPPLPPSVPIHTRPSRAHRDPMLFLLCVCVCDLVLFLQGPSPPSPSLPIHTSLCSQSSTRTGCCRVPYSHPTTSLCSQGPPPSRYSHPTTSLCSQSSPCTGCCRPPLSLFTPDQLLVFTGTLPSLPPSRYSHPTTSLCSQSSTRTGCCRASSRARREGPSSLRCLPVAQTKNFPGTVFIIHI